MRTSEPELEAFSLRAPVVWVHRSLDSSRLDRDGTRSMEHVTMGHVE